MLEQVVITGPVTLTGSSFSPMYEELVKLMCDYAKTVWSPLDTLRFDGPNQERYRRAMDLVAKSSLVIALVSNPSTGQGMEIQEAARHGIPVWAFAASGSKVSGLIQGCPVVREVLYFESTTELARILRERLDQVEGSGHDAVPAQ